MRAPSAQVLLRTMPQNMTPFVSTVSTLTVPVRGARKRITPSAPVPSLHPLLVGSSRRPQRFTA
jgi:hypothetical protein